MPAMEKTRSTSFLPREEEEEEHNPGTKSQNKQPDDGAFILEDALSLSTSSSNPSPETPFYVNVPITTTSAATRTQQPASQQQQSIHEPNMLSRVARSGAKDTRGPLENAHPGNNNRAATPAAVVDDAWSMMDLGSDSSENSDDHHQQQHHNDSFDPLHSSSASSFQRRPVSHSASTNDLLPADFRMMSSGRLLSHSHSAPSLALQEQQELLQQQAAEHRYHLLCQIQEDREANTELLLHEEDNNKEPLSESSTTEPKTPFGSPLRRSGPPPLSQSHSSIHPHDTEAYKHAYFVPHYTCTKIAYAISKRVFDQSDDFAVATWLGFWALLNVTCANYVLSPMRDAIALHVGVQHIPKLTLASSLLAFLSSVPIGWLFEAPDPSRRKVWKKMGLTRGETQGTSLALFYRFFAICVLAYAVGFQLMDWFQNSKRGEGNNNSTEDQVDSVINEERVHALRYVTTAFWRAIPFWLTTIGQFMYVAFFLVMHLMKLHSISLVWGVTTEAMEYEDVARKQQEMRRRSSSSMSLSSLAGSTTTPPKPKTRLQRLALVGFGGTIGGVWGRYVWQLIF